MPGYFEKIRHEATSICSCRFSKCFMPCLDAGSGPRQRPGRGPSRYFWCLPCSWKLIEMIEKTYEKTIRSIYNLYKQFKSMSKTMMACRMALGVQTLWLSKTMSFHMLWASRAEPGQEAWYLLFTNFTYQKQPKLFPWKIMETFQRLPRKKLERASGAVVQYVGQAPEFVQWGCQ